MRTHHFTCMLLLCLIASTACESLAQTRHDSLSAALTMERRISWDDFVQSLYEDGTDYDEDVIEDLYGIHCNPINLNVADRPQLEQLPFLSEEQVTAILHYIKIHRPMMSLGELILISELDYVTRLRLTLFCYVDNSTQQELQPPLKTLLKHGKHEMIVRSDIPFYKKAGYYSVSDSVLAKYPNRVYQGDRFHNSLRYKYESAQHLFAGLQMEKDPGETGIDYWAAYLMLNSIKSIRTFIVGDYKLSFGQGLVVNNSVSFGKLSSLNSSSLLNKGISKHSSLSESNHFRGVAATIRLFKNLNATAFLSYQKIDATLYADSTNGSKRFVASSLKQDGLHRTKLEISKKGNVSEFSTGGNIQYINNDMTIGLTLIYTHLSVPLLPKYGTKNTSYRKINLRGDTFCSAGVNYSLRFHHLLLRGETAFVTNHEGHEKTNSDVATINSLSYAFNSSTSIVLVQRYYGIEYATLYGKSFGESGKPQNESGVYVGVKSQLFKKIYLEAYVDGFHFPYKKYQVSDSSNGVDGLCRLTWMVSGKSSLLLNYRIKAKQKDFVIKTDKTDLYYYDTQSVKLQYKSDLTASISSTTTLYGTFIFNPDANNDNGFMIAHSMRFLLRQSTKHKIDLTAAYFNTTAYSSRVYLYEPSLSYSFGTSSFYGEGLRASILLSLPIIHNLYITGKLSTTRYFDKDSIGTGLEKIAAKHKEDLQIQLRWVI